MASEIPDTAWNDDLLKNPHAQADKRSRVQKMFAAIAPSYDLNNRLHSFWQDQRWRRKAVKLAELRPLDDVVDVACGTGDLSIAFEREASRVVELQMPHEDIHSNVTGIDFTYEMLPRARSKSQIANRKSQISYINGDAQALPLPDQSADVASIAFGIRNVQDPSKALAEFFRVLRPGGRVIILEFSEPTNPVIRALNRFYTHKIMPITATFISRDKTGAYKYLPKSIETFISREKMSQMMRDAGFVDVTQHPMTLGVCVCYRGFKV